MSLKVKFCWLCGNKLRGNHFKSLVVDQHPRILHKACAKEIGRSESITFIEESEYTISLNQAGRK